MVALNELLEDARHIRYVEWLCQLPDMRQPQTAKELAEELGVAYRTLMSWRHRADVRRAWDKFSREIVGDPTKVQEVLEEMRQVALERGAKQQVQAAKVYLDRVDGLRPPDREVEDGPRLQDMSDDELFAAITERMGRGAVDELAEVAGGE